MLFHWKLFWCLWPSELMNLKNKTDKNCFIRKTIKIFSVYNYNLWQHNVGKKMLHAQALVTLNICTRIKCKVTQPMQPNYELKNNFKVYENAAKTNSEKVHPIKPIIKHSRCSCCKYFKHQTLFSSVVPPIPLFFLFRRLRLEKYLRTWKEVKINEYLPILFQSLKVFILKRSGVL